MQNCTRRYVQLFEEALTLDLSCHIARDCPALLSREDLIGACNRKRREDGCECVRAAVEAERLSQELGRDSDVEVNSAVQSKFIDMPWARRPEQPLKQTGPDSRVDAVTGEIADPRKPRAHLLRFLEPTARSMWAAGREHVVKWEHDPNLWGKTANAHGETGHVVARTRRRFLSSCARIKLTPTQLLRARRRSLDAVAPRASCCRTQRGREPTRSRPHCTRRRARPTAPAGRRRLGASSLEWVGSRRQTQRGTKTVSRHTMTRARKNCSPSAVRPRCLLELHPRPSRTATRAELAAHRRRIDMLPGRARRLVRTTAHANCFMASR